LVFNSLSQIGYLASDTWQACAVQLVNRAAVLARCKASRSFRSRELIRLPSWTALCEGMLVSSARRIHHPPLNL
jgi:hypothetical protein